MSVFEELHWRGLVQDASEGVAGALANEKLTLYIGFDPTASSLHVGSLLPMLALARLQRFGHTPIALVGGGTGLIGDPSGKSSERPLLTREQVDENARGIRTQLERVIDFEAAANPARLVDNAEWLATIPLLDFLRDVGKHFTVNYLLAKESVKRRLESEDGLSYTEFSYVLAQAYDFLVLRDRYGCRLQLGGSDQWGNITAGAELIRKLRQDRAYGLVFPLVTTAGGQKFGKTEAGTVWLDPERTSPYRFYQFWLNTTDADVGRYLRFFTFRGREEVEALESAHAAAPGRREAQRELARDVTDLVHGEAARQRAERASAVLFSGGDLAALDVSEIREVFDEVPSSRRPIGDFAGEGASVVDLFAASGLTDSRGAARRLVRDGGAYVNGRRIGDEGARVGVADLLGGSLLVLRMGAKKYHLVDVGEGEA